MSEIELLRNYKRQNPVKYFQKYGDKTPEEAVELLKPSAPFLTGAIKVEVSDVKEVEADFKPIEFNQGIAAVAPVDLPVVEEEKPKRTRKAK